MKKDNPHQKIRTLIDIANHAIERFKKSRQMGLQDFSEDAIKIFYHKKRFSNFLMGDDLLVTPISVEVWPSLTCDARCPLCTYSINKARHAADRSNNLILAKPRIYEHCFDLFKDAGLKSVIVTGGGEPTLNPNLPEFIQSIGRKGFSWGMFTHGLHMNEQMIKCLVGTPPRFVRISINSGSSTSHNREYNLGKDAYEKIKNNVARLTTEFVQNAPVGLGYALDSNVSPSEMSGILSFISDLYEKTDGGMNFVSFRPKITYFNGKGQVVTNSRRLDGLSLLAETIEEKVVSELRTRFGGNLRIDNKIGMFHRASSHTSRVEHLSLGWTTQIDHNGVAYISSERNGSPWPNSRIGSFANAKSFDDVWLGHERKIVMEKYSSGKILSPVHTKVSHIEDLLQEIRKKVGKFSKAETDLFWLQFQAEPEGRPKNWDFL